MKLREESEVDTAVLALIETLDEARRSLACINKHGATPRVEYLYFVVHAICQNVDGVLVAQGECEPATARKGRETHQ